MLAYDLSGFNRMTQRQLLNFLNYLIFVTICQQFQLNCGEKYENLTNLLLPYTALLTYKLWFFILRYDYIFRFLLWERFIATNPL